MRGFILIWSFLLLRIFASGQVKDIVIFGKLNDQNRPSFSLDGAIHVYRDSHKIQEEICNSSGAYRFQLKPGYLYDLIFTSEGYHTKGVRIDTRNIPEDALLDGFELDVNGKLFAFMSEFNLDVLQEPVAVLKYDDEERNFVGDEALTERRTQEINIELNRVERLRKDPDGEASKFSELIREGDDYMSKAIYDMAVGKYRQALLIFPKDEVGLIKLAHALEAWNRFVKERTADSLYHLAMGVGLGHFLNGQWDLAIAGYNAALKHKPGDHDAGDMLYLISLIQNGADTNDEYALWLRKADAEFENKSWESAWQFYRIAQRIQPHQTYPTTQIEIILGIMHPHDDSVVMEGVGDMPPFIEIDNEPDDEDFFVMAHRLDYLSNARLIDSLKTAFIHMLLDYEKKSIQLIQDNHDAMSEAKAHYQEYDQDLQLKIYREIKDRELRLIHSYKDLSSCALRADMEMHDYLLKLESLKQGWNDLSLLDKYRLTNIETIEHARALLILTHEKMSAMCESFTKESLDAIAFKRQVLSAFDELAELHLQMMQKRIDEKIDEVHAFYIEHKSSEGNQIEEALVEIQDDKNVLLNIDGSTSKVPIEEMDIQKSEYTLGNMRITEYSVVKAAETIHYKMVKTDHSTFYFLNERSITEAAWKNAQVAFSE